MTQSKKTQKTRGTASKKAPNRRAKLTSKPRRKAKAVARTGLASVAPRAKRLVSRVKRAVSNAVASR